MFMLVMTACGAEKETAAPEAAEAGTQAAGSQAEKPAGNNTDEEAAEAGECHHHLGQRLAGRQGGRP